ncbi:Short-chain dehydrogenase/reductase SDR [Corchorus capsularis]|uniref:Short-chain dehydrogenase/reductase SDR n=1 Tax=Corchorus capsularis TaxID=210143 RepID=A0A1R3INT2_COCAP|nr:Short-chain dehydrogenase/reductase SDR [Corchorus capsularis]
MDMINNILNVVLPLIVFTTLLPVYPLYIVHKFLNFIKRLISSEDVAGKVVLVTGAASGIGEQISYEYARRGARLALVDIREDRLGKVAEKVRILGSPDVITIRADVSKIEDCERFVDEAVKYFGQLDHLVNNAGTAVVLLFEEVKSLSDCSRVMDVNFWGTIYGTHFALPHLIKSKGKIIVMASTLGWYPFPRAGFYNASKAALISFYETLRCEIGSDNIGITIVMPGLIKSELTQSEAALKAGAGGFVPMESAERCGRAIVKKACRGDKYVTEPSWIISALYPLKVLCPQLVEHCNHFLFVSNSKKKAA